MAESGHLRVFSELKIGGLPVLATLALCVGGSISGAGTENGPTKRLNEVTPPLVGPAPSSVEADTFPEIAFSSAENMAEPQLSLKMESSGSDALIVPAATVPIEVGETPSLGVQGAAPSVNTQTAALETSFDLWANARRASAVTEIGTGQDAPSLSQDVTGTGNAVVAPVPAFEPVAIAVTTPDAPSDMALAAMAIEAKVARPAVVTVAPKGAAEPKSEVSNSSLKSDSAPGLVSASQPVTLATVAQEPEALAPKTVAQTAPELAVADWDYVLPAQAPDRYRQSFVASQATAPLRFATKPAAMISATGQTSGNVAIAQGANSNRGVRQTPRLAPQRGGQNENRAGSFSKASGNAKYRLIGTEIEFQMPVLANGIAVGNLTLHVAANQKLSIHLKELVNLFQDRIDPQVLSTMIDSPNIEAFVSFDQLREAGIDLRYDAARDRLNLSSGQF